MPPPSASIFPCTQWIARGVAKTIPERLRLEPDQLRVVIESAKNKAKEARERFGQRPGQPSTSQQQQNDTSEAMDTAQTTTSDRVKMDLDDDDVAIMQEYGLDDYDDDDIRCTRNNNNNNGNKSDDDDEELAGISSEQDLARDLAALTYYASNQDDPYLQDSQETVSDEEEDDLTIPPTSNLIVCGHVSKGSSSLEVYVYDNGTKEAYLHHDIILTDYPCCVLWLNYAKGADNRNYAAVGDMNPGINLWDLDVVEVIEPLAHLEGHKDATIDLSWNPAIKNVMASGSADKTIRLWNLDECKSQSKIKMPGKVSSVEFNTIEPHLLLAGDLSKNISLLDTRSNESVNRWKICGEIEKVLWDLSKPGTHFLVSDDQGYVYYYDSRSSNQVPLFKFQAHQSSVTGLRFSPVYQSMLITASANDTIKVWDMGCSSQSSGGSVVDPPNLVKELTDLKVGSILSLSMCPDLPAMVAVGGVSKCNSFKTYDLTTDPKVHISPCDGAHIVKYWDHSLEGLGISATEGAREAQQTESMDLVIHTSDHTSKCLLRLLNTQETCDERKRMPCGGKHTI